MTLLIIGPDGGQRADLKASGSLTSPCISEHPRSEKGCLLSWREYFNKDSRDYEIIHVCDSGVIRIEPASGGLGFYVHVETSDPAEMPQLIDWAITYTGGKVSTLDINSVQPNSFVGGVANDLRRLHEAVRRIWRSLKQRIGQFGMKLAR